jgi:hypothetical protein
MANREAADRFAANVLPVIRDIQNSGATSLRAVAAALTAGGVPTARGGTWTPVHVNAILRRASLFRVAQSSGTKRAASL